MADGRAYPPGTPVARNDDRRARGTAFVRTASRLRDGLLAPAAPLVAYWGVTGSAAYGEPEAGDDLDFLVVTRAGALWVFLTFVYLRLRLRKWSERRPEEDHGPREFCFNYVLDAESAPLEFGNARGFLFAREALGSIPLQGEPYYRALLRDAAWMREELPRRFEERTTPAEREEVVGRAPFSIRVLNAVLFPCVATYLQCVGLVRNARFRRAGRSSERFATVTRLRSLAFRTARFEALSAAYSGSDLPAPRSGSTGRDRDAGGAGPTPQA